MATTVIMVGLDELRRALRQIRDKELDDELKAIHQRFAVAIVALAAPNVPVRTGKLLRSLRAAGTKKDAIGRVGSASVPYAAAVHWKHGPPFLRNAADRVEQVAVDQYEAAVGAMLDRVIGR